jgi:hypothetical protein
VVFPGLSEFEDCGIVRYGEDGGSRFFHNGEYIPHFPDGHNFQTLKYY